MNKRIWKPKDAQVRKSQFGEPYPVRSHRQRYTKIQYEPPRGSYSNLVFQMGDMNLRVPVKLGKVTEENLSPNIIQRDTDGNLVKKYRYDKETGVKIDPERMNLVEEALESMDRESLKTLEKVRQLNQIKDLKLDSEILENIIDYCSGANEEVMTVIKGMQKTVKGGYGWAYYNDQGKRVEKSDIKYFQAINGEETPVDPYEATWGGKQREMVTKSVISEDNADRYVISGMKTMFATDARGVKDLWKIAKWLKQEKKAIVTEFMYSEGFNLKYGIITPQFDPENKQWIFLVRVTSQEVSPAFQMPYPEKIEIGRPREPRRRVEQEELFSRKGKH